MPHLKSLPPDAVLRDVFHAFPATARPLLEYHEALLRGPSPLSVAERELIAAYVSGLNACSYCTGAHTATAAAFGMAPALLDALWRDVDTSPVAPRLKPLLRYVAKLTRTPARLTEADAAEVFAAGWDDRALHDAVSVCGLFNLMNRLVEGLGLAGRPEYFKIAGERLHREGYAGLANGLPAPTGANAAHVPPVTA